MAFQRPFLISLKRGDSAQKWGFNINGGKDHCEPLIIQTVMEDSLAEKFGLREGDEVIQVGRVNVQDLSLGQVYELLARCGNKIEMFVVREDLFSPRKGKEPPVVKAIVHNPYNSPLSLYSTENIADTLAKQTEVLTEGHISTEEDEGPENLSFKEKSAVFKLLEEQATQESGQKPYTRGVSQNTIVSKPKVAPPPPPKPRPPAEEHLYNGYGVQQQTHQDHQNQNRVEYQSTQKVLNQYQYQQEQPAQYQSSTVYEVRSQSRSPGYHSPSLDSYPSPHSPVNQFQPNSGYQSPTTNFYPQQQQLNYQQSQPSYYQQQQTHVKSINQQSYQQNYQQEREQRQLTSHQQQLEQQQRQQQLEQQQRQHHIEQQKKQQQLEEQQRQQQLEQQQRQQQLEQQQRQQQLEKQRQHQLEQQQRQQQLEQQQRQRYIEQQQRQQQLKNQASQQQHSPKYSEDRQTSPVVSKTEFKIRPAPPPRNSSVKHDPDKMTAVYKQQYEQHLQHQYELQQQMLLNHVEDDEKPKVHLINGNIFEHNSTSGTPITYKAPPAAPPKPNWPPPPTQADSHRNVTSQSPTGMNVAAAWPPKRSTATEMPRTGFDPAAVRGQGSGRRCVWPPPSDEMRSGCNTPQSPATGRKIQWNPSPSPPLNRRNLFSTSQSPTRRKDIQWPPPSPAGAYDKENLPRQSPRMARKARFDEYVKEHASINVPQTYRPPPGTQHVEFY